MGCKRKAQLVAHMVDDGLRHADFAGIGELLQPCGDVHALAIAVVALDDHVAQGDGHAHLDAPLRLDPLVALRHAPLQRHGAVHGVDHAAELRQQSVAHQLEDAAVMLCDLRLEQFLAVRPQPFERVSLVPFHEPAIAGYIGGEDGGEMAFHRGTQRLAMPDLRQASVTGRGRPRRHLPGRSASGPRANHPMEGPFDMQQKGCASPRRGLYQ